MFYGIIHLLQDGAKSKIDNCVDRNEYERRAQNNKNKNKNFNRKTLKRNDIRPDDTDVCMALPTALHLLMSRDRFTAFLAAIMAFKRKMKEN